MYSDDSFDLAPISAAASRPSTARSRAIASSQEEPGWSEQGPASTFDSEACLLRATIDSLSAAAGAALQRAEQAEATLAHERAERQRLVAEWDALLEARVEARLQACRRELRTSSQQAHEEAGCRSSDGASPEDERQGFVIMTPRSSHARWISDTPPKSWRAWGKAADTAENSPCCQGAECQRFPEDTCAVAAQSIAHRLEAQLKELVASQVRDALRVAADAPSTPQRKRTWPERRCRRGRGGARSTSTAGWSDGSSDSGGSGTERTPRQPSAAVWSPMTPRAQLPREFAHAQAKELVSTEVKEVLRAAADDATASLRTAAEELRHLCTALTLQVRSAAPAATSDPASSTPSAARRGTSTNSPASGAAAGDGNHRRAKSIGDYDSVFSGHANHRRVGSIGNCSISPTTATEDVEPLRVRDVVKQWEQQQKKQTKYSWDKDEKKREPLSPGRSRATSDAAPSANVVHLNSSLMSL